MQSLAKFAKPMQMPLFARAFDASMTLYFTVGMTYEELIDYSNMIPVTETESLEMMD